jgi:HK97 family phage portal protein
VSPSDRLLPGEVRQVGVGSTPYQSFGVQPGSVSSSHSTDGAFFSPTGWLNANWPQSDQFDSRSSIDRAYLAEVYTYRCIQSITRSITGCPFVAGPDMLNSSSLNKSSELMRLFSSLTHGQPNPHWSPVQLLRYMLGQYVLTGKTAALKVTGPDGKLQLWPLAVQALKPVPGKQSGDAYFIGYDYGVRGSTENYRFLLPQQVLYMYNASLSDVRQPESVIQAGQVSISLLRMLNLYDYNFMKNNATPSTLITTPPFAEKDERRAFQDQFIAEYGGYQNAGKVAFVESEDSDLPGSGAGTSGAVSVQRIGSTAKEAELSLLSDAVKDDICLMWGVPRSVLGDSSGKTFANSGQDRRNYWLETLDPTASEFADQINTHLAPELGRDFGWFDVSSVPELQSDKLITAVNLVDLVANHVITRDEARTELGLLPWDDVATDLDQGIPFGPAPGETVVNPPGKTSPFGTEAKTPQSLSADAAAQTASPTTATPVEIPAVASAGRDMLSAARLRREARHAGPDGHHPIPSGHPTLGVISAMLTSQLRRLLAEQQAEAQKRLSGQRGMRKARECAADRHLVYDVPYWTERMVVVLEPLYGDRSAGLAQAQAERTLAALGTADPDTALTTAMDAFQALLTDLQEVNHGA